MNSPLHTNSVNWTYSQFLQNDAKDVKTESEKHEDPRIQDPRKVWKSEEGLPKNSRVMSRFQTLVQMLQLICINDVNDHNPTSILICKDNATHCEEGILSYSNFNPHLYPHLQSMYSYFAGHSQIWGKLGYVLKAFIPAKIAQK